MLINPLRAHLAEFGVIAPQGIGRVPEFIADLQDGRTRLPEIARAALGALVAQLGSLQACLREVERQVVAWRRTNDAARRLATIPGVGPITASAIAATVADPPAFRSARHFAAWPSLVPKQNSTGAKARLGRICKRGDRYLRKLLVVGMTAVDCARRTRAPALARVNALLERRPARLVTVALANKTARVAWAILARGEVYRAPIASAA